jgi:hypothetical protein
MIQNIGTEGAAFNQKHTVSRSKIFTPEPRAGRHLPANLQSYCKIADILFRIEQSVFHNLRTDEYLNAYLRGLTWNRFAL